jgi:hypothetical protein
MDQDNSASISNHATRLGGKSWTAYFGVVFFSVVLLLLATPAAWAASWVAGLVILVLSVLYLGYKIALLRSYKLYYDDVGVWLYSGVLPWKKGVSGVKWRDLDESVYVQNLWSWLFKSYSMRIGHRFTKSSEILLTHMARGHESVMAINAKHQELIRTNRLS